ncbi:DUF4089 domain-containing protein [Roseibium porphyridii]|uniref:DUF4089 domain-containing protein n=1 Tax=Roseibium porphyridii TaxID=2866279 RepID=A0ABY8FDH1_9HYPH|nr:DUF4089 domain-containing protein [Roseibium sp. KMA01]WFE92252.1 DUF4089 domain-containing protein [Roseibium sp. KMA01]
MSKPFQADDHVAHMEQTLDLTIEADWRPVVKMHITAIEKAAQSVLEFPLEDDIEAAPVFRP